MDVNLHTRMLRMSTTIMMSNHYIDHIGYRYLKSSFQLNNLNLLFFWSVEQFESNMTLLLFYKDLIQCLINYTTKIKRVDVYFLRNAVNRRSVQNGKRSDSRGFDFGGEPRVTRALTQ